MILAPVAGNAVQHDKPGIYLDLLEFESHLHPLIENKYTTGYVSEIHNLVPCCSECNSKKRNLSWQDYMDGDFFTHDEGWQKRRDLLEKYDAKHKRIMITEEDFQRICGDKWTQHWKNLERLEEQMKEYQILSDEIRERLRDEFVKTPVRKKSIIFLIWGMDERRLG